MSDKQISSKDRRKLAKQRKLAANEAKKYHKEQAKTAKKSSDKERKKLKQSKKSDRDLKSHSIEEAVKQLTNEPYENLSHEERYRRESDEKIKNLEPQDFEDGYYIDEFSARRRQKQRIKELHEQEQEPARKLKKPLSAKQFRLKRILLCSSICAVVVIIGAVLSLTVLFKTENIEVEGNKYYYDDQIIGFSSVEMQKNIFLAKWGSTPELIQENLPYIESASVDFVIPDTIVIKVKNAVPSYVIKNGNDFLIISSKGRIIDRATENTSNLPELKCGELKSTKVGEYISFNDDNVIDILNDVAKSLSENNIEKITSIDVTDTANISFVYDGRITIKLGLPDDIDYKLRTAITIINEKLDPNKTGTISGTLDVSSCNINKMSHYKPADNTVPSTVAATTVPDEGNGNTDDYTWQDGNGYTDNGYDAYADNGYNDYDDGGDVYTDNGYDAYADGGDVYADNGYDAYADPDGYY